MSNSTKEQEIIEGLKPVCICKGIKKKAILEKIKDGVTTVEGLKKSTGAGSGPCKGERCTPRILKCLREQGCISDKSER
jgi:bacterioferritin-associated ferredoxin